MTLFARIIRQVMRRLLIWLIIIAIIVAVTLYFIGKVPISYAINVMGIRTVPDVTLYGTIASGTAEYRHAQLSTPQIIRWQRDGWRRWQVRTSGALSEGLLQIQPSIAALHIDNITLTGVINSADFINSTTVMTPLFFRYRTDALAIDVDWAKPWARATAGTLYIDGLQLNETGIWALLGNYQANFSAQAWETTARLHSDADNLFVVSGNATLLPSLLDQQPPQAELILSGDFLNHNKQLRFPWFIPISGAKTDRGYPVDLRLPIVLPSH